MPTPSDRSMVRAREIEALLREAASPYGPFISHSNGERDSAAINDWQTRAAKALALPREDGATASGHTVELCCAVLACNPAVEYRWMLQVDGREIAFSDHRADLIAMYSTLKDLLVLEPFGAGGGTREQDVQGSDAWHMVNLLRAAVRCEDWDEFCYLRPKIEHRLAAERSQT